MSVETFGTDDYENKYLEFKLQHINTLKKLKKMNRILIVASTLFIIGYTIKFFIGFNWIDIFIIGIWIFNLVTNIRQLKTKNKNIKKAYNEYYSSLKEFDPERYMKLMRTKKLKNIC